MDINALVREWFAPLRRTAWFPLVLRQDGPEWSSKFGGVPFIPEGESHPICSNCTRPMELLLQLDVATLPDPARFGGDGLVQLFFCTHRAPKCEHCLCGHGNHGPRSLLARRGGAGARRCASTAVTAGVVLPKHIVEWEAADDYPHCEESKAREVAERMTDEQMDAWLAGDTDLWGEKLGGWPVWRQAAVRPPCPRCSQPMESIFQIDSNDLVEIAWDDAGVAHLFQCAQHPDELAFTWEGD